MDRGATGPCPAEGSWTTSSRLRSRRARRPSPRVRSSAARSTGYAQRGDERRELGVRDLDAPLGSAAAGPRLGGLDQAAAQFVDFVIALRQLVAGDLDSHLVHRGLG